MRNNNRPGPSRRRRNSNNNRPGPSQRRRRNYNNVVNLVSSPSSSVINLTTPPARSNSNEYDDPIDMETYSKKRDGFIMLNTKPYAYGPMRHYISHRRRDRLVPNVPHTRRPLTAAELEHIRLGRPPAPAPPPPTVAQHGQMVPLVEDPSLVIRRPVTTGRQETYRYVRVHRRAGQPARWTVEQFRVGAPGTGTVHVITTWAQLLDLVLTSRPVEYHFCTDFNPITGGGHWTRVVFQEHPGAPVRDRFQRGTRNDFRRALEAQVNPVHRQHLPIGT